MAINPNSVLVLYAYQRFKDLKAYADSKGYSYAQAAYQIFDDYIVAWKATLVDGEAVESDKVDKVDKVDVIKDKLPKDKPVR